MLVRALFPEGDDLQVISEVRDHLGAVAVQLDHLLVMASDHEAVLRTDLLGVLPEPFPLLVLGDILDVYHLDLPHGIGLEILPAKLCLVLGEIHLFRFLLNPSLSAFHEVLGLFEVPHDLLEGLGRAGQG